MPSMYPEADQKSSKAADGTTVPRRRQRNAGFTWHLDEEYVVVENRSEDQKDVGVFYDKDMIKATRAAKARPAEGSRAFHVFFGSTVDDNEEAKELGQDQPVINVPKWAWEQAKKLPIVGTWLRVGELRVMTTGRVTAEEGGEAAPGQQTAEG